MAVREFDPSNDDDIVRAIGALSDMTYGTVVALVKPVQTGTAADIFEIHTSGDVPRASVFFENDASDWWLGWFNTADDDGDETNFTDFTNEWWLIVWRKPPSTATARMSAYDGSTWVHDDLDFFGTTPGEWLAPGADGTVAFSELQSGNFFFQGRVAAVAAWSNSLPWAANTTGDSAIEVAGLEEWAKNWFDNNPDAMWRFNQDSTSTDVTDDTGNGADQISITGTTVVTGDDPPGFDFSITIDEANPDAEAATVAIAAHDPMSMVMPTAEEATADTVAHDPAVARTGEPDAETATVAVAAQDATVDAVGDTVEADAEAATISVAAHGATTTVSATASRASVATAAHGADISVSDSASAGVNFIGVAALNATVQIDAEDVSVNAEAATVSVVAHNATPTGEANAEAEAATITVAAEGTDKRVFAGEITVDVEARDPQVAIDAGVIANAERAEVQVAALNATVAVSDNVSDTPFVADVAVAAFNATVSVLEPAPPTYSFFPPTIDENLVILNHPDRDFLQRLHWEKGQSVVKKDGEFVTVRYVVPSNLDGQTEGVHYFVGGFHYSQIPEDVALQLIADGYEPELNEV